MAKLLDLSNELLLQIGSYLKPSKPVLTQGPYFRWPGVLKKQTIAACQQNLELYQLVLASKQFYNVLNPTLYDYVAIDQGIRCHKRLECLFSTLENHPSFATYITSVHVCSDGAFSFQNLFWLPNINTISIHDFRDWQALEWEDDGHFGGSVVKALHLSKCGAHEAALTDLLSWPAGLQELWYDADQGEWSGHLEGEEEIEYSCVAVERALSKQYTTLEKLVFSRETPVHEGLGYGSLLPLKEYPKLKSLSINHAFLVSSNPDAKCWENLPKGLEELDIFYDDSGYFDFLKGDSYPGWLFGLLEHKQECVPALQRVRITAFEWYEGMDSDEEEDSDSSEEEDRDPVQKVVENWTPPKMLLDSFKRAEVSFSLYLHAKRRFSITVEGGRGFENAWEDTWDGEGYS